MEILHLEIYDSLRQRTGTESKPTLQIAIRRFTQASRPSVAASVLSPVNTTRRTTFGEVQIKNTERLNT